MNVSRLAENLVFSAVVLSSFAVSATTFYLKPLKSDWTSVDSYYDNDEKPPEQKKIPVAGDRVYLVKGNTFTLTAPSASFDLANSLTDIYQAEKATLEITVDASADEQTLDCPVSCWSGTGTVPAAPWGTVVKKGGGSLALAWVTNAAYFAGTANADNYAYFANLDVQEGVLKLPEHVTMTNNLRCGDVNVGPAGTLHLLHLQDLSVASGTSGLTKIGELSGSGVVTNISPTTDYAKKEFPRRLVITKASTFDGILGGGIIPVASGAGVCVTLTGTNSTFRVGDGGIPIEGIRASYKVKKFYAGEGETQKSSMGYTKFFRASSVSNVVEYIGPGGEVTEMGMNVSHSPFILDVGAAGGVEFRGSGSAQEWRGLYGSVTPPNMQYIWLTGSNTQACVFSPYLRCWTDGNSKIAAEDKTNCTWHITKKGTGTWLFQKFTHPNPTLNTEANGWCGNFIAEEGTAQFDSLKPVGTNCSFGYGTMPQVPYEAPWTPTKNVDYHLGLGGTAAVPTLACVGSNIVVNTANSRKVGVLTQGRIVNENVRRLVMTGAMAASAGSKTLILDGTGEKMDTFNDIGDGPYGGTLGVTKRGTGEWCIGGSLSFSGPLKVENGTLRVNDDRHYRYFKWTVRQVLACEADYPEHEKIKDSNYGVKIDELALFDTASNRVNVGMKTVVSQPESKEDMTSDYV